MLVGISTIPSRRRTIHGRLLHRPTPSRRSRCGISTIASLVPAILSVHRPVALRGHSVLRGATLRGWELCHLHWRCRHERGGKQRRIRCGCGRKWRRGKLGGSLRLFRRFERTPLCGSLFRLCPASRKCSIEPSFKLVNTNGKGGLEDAVGRGGGTYAFVSAWKA